MTPQIIILILTLYFASLFLISHFTSKNSDNETFFTANKKSPWFIVTFGMIGATLSGVTFISVPGWVGTSNFSYFQMVIGNLLGYMTIAFILIPIYYKLKLTSIYTYLNKRFGLKSYKTGAIFFIISRVIGASFRLYLVANVFHLSIFEPLNLGIPFSVTVIITLLLIWLYTFKGGIKTILWTDTLQTFFILASVIITIWAISDNSGFTIKDIFNKVESSQFSRIFFFDDINNKFYFFKQFLSGVFIAIVMTGLDQDMMQKNLTCKNTNDAKKNIIWFGFIILFVNLLFLSLGVLLYEYGIEEKIITLTKNSSGSLLYIKDMASSKMILRRTDDLFPILATQGFLPPIAGIFFILGLTASAYSSADSALTALTTSLCIDILSIDKYSIEKQEKIRKTVHILFSIILVIVILIFRALNDQSVISAIFTVAGYTYGPILGLFAFGIFTNFNVKDKFVPIIAILSPIICYILKSNSQFLFKGYEFGFELLILNGTLTFIGLLFIRKK